MGIKGPWLFIALKVKNSIGFLQLSVYSQLSLLKCVQVMIRVAIFSSFKSMAIFTIASADIADIQLMLY